MTQEYLPPQLIVGKAPLKGASNFFMSMFGKKNMAFLMLQGENKNTLQKKKKANTSSSLV